MEHFKTDFCVAILNKDSQNEKVLEGKMLHEHVFGLHTEKSVYSRKISKFLSRNITYPILEVLKK